MLAGAAGGPDGKHEKSTFFNRMMRNWTAVLFDKCTEVDGANLHVCWHNDFAMVYIVCDASRCAYCSFTKA